MMDDVLITKIVDGPLIILILVLGYIIMYRAGMSVFNALIARLDAKDKLLEKLQHDTAQALDRLTDAINARK